MIAVTVLCALVAAVLCAVLRPATALGVIVASALLWPEYMRIPMGVVQMSVPRVAALVLVIRLLLAPGHGAQWRAVDGLVIGLYLWNVFANAVAGTSTPQFRTIVGSMFDTVLMYAAARLAFARYADIGGMVKGLVVAAVSMAAVGAVEAVTRWSPYIPLLRYANFGEDALMGVGGGADERLGMRRAFGTTAQPIYFGMVMAFVTGMVVALREWFSSRYIFAVVLGAAVIATLASLSSGPWMALILIFALNAFFFARWAIKPALVGVVLMGFFLEVLSNRHFYHLIDYLALNRGTAYYRTRLMEVAVMKLPEYWMFGYGGREASDWGPLIDHRSFVDMVNHYVVTAYWGGLPALVLYVAAKIAALVMLVKAFRMGTPGMKKVTFALGALLVAYSISEFSVALFALPLVVSYLMLGCAVSTREWVAVPRVAAVRGVVRSPNRTLRPAFRVGGGGVAAISGAGASARAAAGRGGEAAGSERED